MSQIRLINAKGDEAVATWTPGTVDEEKAAREVFDGLMGPGKGYAAFAVDMALKTEVDPKTGESTTKLAPEKGVDTLIKKFDPSIETILVIPPVQGG